LNLQLNQISSFQGFDTHPNLLQVDLFTNNISSIPQLSLPKLKWLNLCKNQISSSEFSFLPSLEYLNLGSNKISKFPNLQKQLLLSELLLNSNQIEQVDSFSFPILKTFKINVNKLVSFNMGFCPLLETLNLSDNLLTEINVMSNFPLLKNLDLSFN